MGWAPEKLETLKTLWSKGFSATQIAQEIGGTRSSILGQVHRMREHSPELFSRRRLENMQRRPKAKPVARRVRAPISHERPVAFTPAVVDLPPLNVSLLELAFGQCRYPVSDLPPHVFCGHPQQPESSYCGQHHKISHQLALVLSDEERARRSAQARNNNAMRRAQA